MIGIVIGLIVIIAVLIIHANNKILLDIFIFLIMASIFLVNNFLNYFL